MAERARSNDERCRADDGYAQAPGDSPPGLAATWERLALALTTGVALAAGCGPGTIGSDDDAGEDSPTSATAGDDQDASSITTTSTTASTDVPPPATTGPGDGNDDASEGDGPRFDLGIQPDIVEDTNPNDCFDPPPAEPACDVELERGQHLGYRCVPQRVQFSCEGYDPLEVQREADACLSCSGHVDDVPCGPVSSGNDTCCFWFVYTPGQSCPGRPFTVEGCSRLPLVVPGDGWADVVELRASDLPLTTRRVLAEAWAQDGCFEHASVASFARFVMELLALGAPPSLIAGAQRAMGEEVGHARVFFGLASAYGGRPVGPGALDVRGGLDSSHDPAEIATRLAREGCIAETISALQLRVAAGRATDPQLRASLTAIADEELRHAELAWSALAWLMARGGASLRERVARTLADAARYVPRAADASDGVAEAVLHAHGRLSAPERLALAERALEGLVGPATAQLLRPWTVEAGELRGDQPSSYSNRTRLPTSSLR